MGNGISGRPRLGASTPYRNKEWLAARIGRTFADIAKEAGCRPRTISIWARRHGLVDPPMHRNLEPLRNLIWDEMDAAFHYQEGYSLRAISKAMHVSHETVRTALIDLGVELRGRGSA